MYDNILKLAKTYEVMTKKALDTKSTELGVLQDVLINSKAVPLKSDDNSFDKKIDQESPLFIALWNEMGSMVQDTTNVSMDMLIGQDGNVSISVIGNGKPLKKVPTVVKMEKLSSSAIKTYLAKYKLNLEGSKDWKSFLNFTIQF